MIGISRRRRNMYRNSHLRGYRWPMYTFICIGFLLTTALVSSNSQGHQESGSSCYDLCGYDDWVHYANCSGRGLRRIPYPSCQSARTLEINNNQINILPSHAFNNFQDIRHLYLIHSNLSNIRPNAFSGLRDVINVRLGGNCFPRLERDVVRGLEGIVILRVRGGCVKSIERGTFESFAEFAELDLRGNRLAAPPCGAFGSENKLRTITLSDNLITDLPNFCFGELGALEILNLDGNNLTLVRNRNALTGLSRLTLLSLDRTSLYRVPANFFQKIPSLLSLSLARNNISNLPSTAFNGLHNLTYLNIAHNSINRLHSDAFGSNPLLREIDLSVNAIKHVSGGTFDGLKQLRLLDLSANHLTAISNFITDFQWLSEVARISLADNPLVCECEIADSSHQWLWLGLVDITARCKLPKTDELVEVSELSLLPICDNDRSPLYSAGQHNELVPSTVSIKTVDLRPGHLFPNTLSPRPHRRNNLQMFSLFPRKESFSTSPKTNTQGRKIDLISIVIISITALLSLAALFLTICIMHQCRKYLKGRHDGVSNSQCKMYVQSLPPHIPAAYGDRSHPVKDDHGDKESTFYEFISFDAEAVKAEDPNASSPANSSEKGTDSTLLDPDMNENSQTHLYLTYNRHDGQMYACKNDHPTLDKEPYISTEFQQRNHSSETLSQIMTTV